MKKKINQKEAIKKLKTGEKIDLFEIEFNDEAIEVLEAVLLEKNNIEVPKELVYYDDDIIDYSDDPELTEEELKQLKPVIHIPVIPLQKEVKEWLLNSDIDLMKLASELLENYYYDNVKNK